MNPLQAFLAHLASVLPPDMLNLIQTHAQAWQQFNPPGQNIQTGPTGPGQITPAPPSGPTTSPIRPPGQPPQNIVGTPPQFGPLTPVNGPIHTGPFNPNPAIPVSPRYPAPPMMPQPPTGLPIQKLPPLGPRPQPTQTLPVGRPTPQPGPFDTPMHGSFGGSAQGVQSGGMKDTGFGSMLRNWSAR